METASLVLIILTAISALVFIVCYSVWFFRPRGPNGILGWWLITLNSAILLLASFSALQTLFSFEAHPVVRIVVLGLVASCITAQNFILYCLHKKVR